MAKVKEPYKILASTDCDRLSDDVNDMIAKGYSVHGDLIFSGGLFAQAVINYSEK